MPELLEEVRVKVPGVQNVVGPLGVTTGTGGVGLTVTTIAFETAEVHPDAMMVVV